MQHRQQVFPNPDPNRIPTVTPISILPKWIESFLLDGKSSQHSQRTINLRRETLLRVVTWLQSHDVENADKDAMRLLLIHLREGHDEEKGRFGLGLKTPLRPITIFGYYRELRTFFNWCVEEELIAESPLKHVKPPVTREEQIDPFTEGEMERLLQVASSSRRDYALICLLLDTGMRATEVCSLLVGDLNWLNHEVTIIGKGNKKRLVPFGKDTKAALWKYVQSRAAQPSDTLFVSEGGHTPGRNMTRAGIYSICSTIAKHAGLSRDKIGSHAMRHTCAIQMLRNGGNAFFVKEMLGHSSTKITERYVKYSDANLRETHRATSPIDNMKRRK